MAIPKHPESGMDSESESTSKMDVEGVSSSNQEAAKSDDEPTPMEPLANRD